MKLVKRSHRILAVLMGIAIMVTLMVQILRDGRVAMASRAKQEQQQTIKH